MSDGIEKPSRFTLRIVIDHFELDWTTLGNMDGTIRRLHEHMVARRKAAREKPLTLKIPLTRLLRHLSSMGIDEISLHKETTHICVVPEHLKDPLKDSLLEQALTQNQPFTWEDLVAIIELTAWWIDYERARDNNTGEWTCPDCESVTSQEHIHCPDPECSSWNMIHAITGDPIMQPLQTKQRRFQAQRRSGK